MTKFHWIFLWVAVVVIALVMVPKVVHLFVMHEVRDTKTELIQDVKKDVSAVNDTVVAKGVAKALHKIKRFKTEVKQELQKLDSISEKKNESNK
jgi:prefoldin subunit 5